MFVCDLVALGKGVVSDNLRFRLNLLRRLVSRDEDNEELKLPVSLRCVGPGITPLQVQFLAPQKTRQFYRISNLLVQYSVHI